MVELLKTWAPIRMHAPFLWVEPGLDTPRGAATFLRTLSKNKNSPSILLVAGNCESTWPRIGERTERFLVAMFGMFAKG